MSEPRILLRTGNSPLRIVSDHTEIFTLSSKDDPKKRNWFTLAAYQVAEKIVVSISFASSVPTEPGYDDAFVCSSNGMAAAKLKAFDPTEHVVGYAPGSGKTRSGQPKDEALIVEKQAKIKRAIRRDWETLLSRALVELGDVEEI